MSKGLIFANSAVITIAPSVSEKVDLVVEKVTEVSSLSTILKASVFWLLFILAFPAETFEAVNITDSDGSSIVSAVSVRVNVPLDSLAKIVIVAALNV